jgi:AcrR family transcriptional regulator
MQDICREAGISSGALYIYFASKEALIAGLCERDRAEFQSRFADLAAAGDFMQALQALGEQYFVDEPAHKRLMCVEIGVESTRNAQVGQIYRSVDDYVHDCFQSLFQRMKDDGRIAPSLDIPTLARVFTVIGDGMIWRRAIDASFDGKTLMPAVVQLVSDLLKPVTPAAASTPSRATQEAAE